MNPSPRQFRRSWTTFAPFLVAWGLLVALAIYTRYRDPFGTSPDHPGYGENLPGDLASTLILGACETGVLMFMLWPRMQRWSRVRLIVALALYAPWTMVASMTTMHAGSISATIVVWRVAIILSMIAFLLALTVRSGIRRVRAV